MLMVLVATQVREGFVNSRLYVWTDYKMLFPVAVLLVLTKQGNRIIQNFCIMHGTCAVKWNQPFRPLRCQTWRLMTN